MSVELAESRKKFVDGSGVMMELNEWTIEGRIYRNWKFQRIGDKNEITMGGDQAKKKGEEKVEVDVKSKEKKKNKPKKSESERSVEVDSPLVKCKKGKQPTEMEDDPSLVKMIDLEQPPNVKGSVKKGREKKPKTVKLIPPPASVSSEVSVRRRSPIARNAKQRRVELEEKRDRMEEVKRESAEKAKKKQESREYLGPVPKRESSECDLDKSLKMAIEKKTKRMSREQLTEMCFTLQQQMNAMQMSMLSDIERIRVSKSRAAISTVKQIGKILTKVCEAYTTVTQLIGEEELPDAKEKMSKLQAFIDAIATLDK